MRGNRLKDLASCVLGSFVSRNNDVGGYWAIGKLYLHATEANVDSVTIDLVDGTLTPASPAFDNMLQQYSAMLIEQAKARKLDHSNLTTALIVLYFGLPAGALSPTQYKSSDDAYSCAIRLVGDRDRIHTAQCFGYAAPHDAKRKLKSAQGAQAQLGHTKRMRAERWNRI
jgi:hypothetical protein